MRSPSYYRHICGLLALIFLFALHACKMPPENKKSDLRIKHNYIILLDLSDRLIVQDDQPERDKQIIKNNLALLENLEGLSIQKL